MGLTDKTLQEKRVQGDRWGQKKIGLIPGTAREGEIP